MAGRRPRKTPDEQAGTDPLKPRPAHQFQPGNRPANAFAPGNRISATGNLSHGMHSKMAIKDRADHILLAMLEDPRCPDHLHTPAFAPALMAWSRAEAVASLAYDWMNDLWEAEGPAAIFTMHSVTGRTPSEVWKGHEAFASSLRAKLGMDPVSYARISRDLGLASAATEDRLARMADAGKQVTAERLGITAKDPVAQAIDALTADEPVLHRTEARAEEFTRRP